MFHKHSRCNTTIPDYICKTVNNQIIDGTCIRNIQTTLYCPTNNPSTDSGCDASVSVTNHYKCTFVEGTRSEDCVDQLETVYCPTNNPSTDSGCATQISATNPYKCTFVGETRSGDCVEQLETVYCPTNNPNTDSGCATQLSATNHYKCTFVEGTRSGDCTEIPHKYVLKITTSKLTCTTSDTSDTKVFLLMMDRMCGAEKGDITSKLLKICFTEDGEDKCFTCDNDSYTVSFTSREFFSYISRVDVGGIISCGMGYSTPLAHYASCDNLTQTKIYRQESDGSRELTNWQD